jgi:L-2-hydroxyglutarate oxidase LhgO
MPADHVDCVVIGAGVVGLAIARALSLKGRDVLVLEAERAIGTGSSSRNSEVIHAGIYYPTASLKAELCVTGRGLLYAYCEARQISHRRLGKLIVATSAEELPVLGNYLRQARANGVEDLTELGAVQARTLEPEVDCVAGLFSPSTGILDTHGLMLAYQADLEARGGIVSLGSPVTGGALSRGEIELSIGGRSPMSLRTSMLVNAAGLTAQRISASLDGLRADAVPGRFLAKGHYYALTGRSPFGRLVYPIGSSANLGTHATLDLHGQTRFGPDVAWIGEVDYAFDDSRRASFVAAIRRYYPKLDESRLQPAYTGIRPKIVGPAQPAADFCIRGPADHDGCPYVALYGIESPGLTASLAIAQHVVQLLH